MFSKKRAFKAISLLWLSSLIGAGSTFLIFVILARQLGPNKFGIFSSALSTVTMFTLLVSFGIPQLWLKIFGKEGINGVRWFSSSIRLILIFSCIVSLIIGIWSLYGPHDEQTKSILFILISYMIGQVVIELVSSKLQLEEKYIRLALWQLLPNLIRLILVILLKYFFYEQIDGIKIASIYCFTSALFILLGVYQLNQMPKRSFELQGHKVQYNEELVKPKIRELLSQTWPFGVSTIFAFIYVQSDIILVNYISGDSEAGFYRVSFIILTAIYLFPTVLYQKFLLPKFHRWSNHDRKKFYTAYKNGNIVMLISGTIAMFIIWATSSWIIPLVFGKNYFNSISLTNIVALTIPMYFLAYSAGAVLVTQSHMKLKVKIMGGVALINLGLNIILIPLYNAHGAAITTVISNLILLIFYYLSAERIVFSKRNSL